MPNPFHPLLERYHRLNIRPPITAALIGGTFVLLAALVNLLATAVKTNPQAPVVSVKPVETPPAQQAKPTDPFEFAQAVIDSLSWAADARQTIVSTEVKGEGAADSLRSMTNARIAINKLVRAHGEIQRFSNSDNKFVNVAVRLFDAAYRQLIASLNESIRAEEKLLSVSNEQELGALLSETSKWAAVADEAWKALVYASAATAHVLVDYNRPAEGNQVHLTITADQRAKLMRELESHFGESVRSGLQAGQHATEAAPAALWGFLNEPWQTAELVTP